MSDILPPLDGDLQRLAIRLVLLPRRGGPVWDAIQAEVSDGLDPGHLDDLCHAERPGER